MKKYKEFLKENIDIFDNDEWDDEELDSNIYYYGIISYDHVEIYPCELNGGLIIRTHDNEVMSKVGNVAINKLNTKGVHVQTELIYPVGKFIFIYSPHIDNEKIIKELKNSLKDLEYENFKNTIINIIDTQDIIYRGNDWMNINII